MYLLKPFPVLSSLKVRLIFASGMFVFSLLFLLLFIPFNITEWIVYTSPFKALQIPGLAVIVGVIFFISQLLQYFLFRGVVLRNIHLFVSLLLDIVFISIPLSVLYSIPANSFWIEFKETLAIVTPLAVLSYLLGVILMVLWNNHNSKQVLSEGYEVDISSVDVDRISVKDSNGQVRLSLRSDDLLYFESADNYVIVYFRRNQKIGRELIRNSLKNIETDHLEHKCIRCHRSFIVNFSNVIAIKKRCRAYEIEIERVDFAIPISRGYVKNIKELIGG